ncbi:MAG: sulfatase-like hydrolase/transferase [bacterium]|nr:MAG: sulfatase-like hydrolase/transferase [bacterium]
MKKFWKLFLSNAIEINISNKEKLISVIVSLFFCIIFFLIGGYYLNRYILPGFYSPMSIFGDIVFLIFTILIGWLLIKINIAKLMTLLSKPFRITALILSIVILVLNVGIMVESRIHTPTGPNVILMISETLRADHVGCYGYQRNNSDNIDLFSDTAFNFLNAYTVAPCTKPSVWNILTSLYYSKMPARDDYVIISEYFKAKNYKTAAFISHHFLEEKKANLHQGFDVYDSKCRTRGVGMATRTATSIINESIKWVEKNKNSPFFVWLFFYDPHDPYVPPDEHQGYYNKSKDFSGDRRAEGIHFESEPISPEQKEFLINAYDEEIKYLDYEIGRFLEYLKSVDEFDESIVILTADHGEELGDNGNRWDHCQLVSQEEIAIPLLIKLQGQKEKVVIRDAVQNIDIYPTIVEHIDAYQLPVYYYMLEGQSLMQFIMAEESTEERAAFSFWGKQRCIIKGQYKYRYWKGDEYLINLATGELVYDDDLRNTLIKQLSEQYEKVIQNEDYHRESLRHMRTTGYIH